MSELPPPQRAATRPAWLIPLLGSSAIVLIVVAVLELASFLYLSERKARYPQLFRFDLDAYVDQIPEERLALYAAGGRAEFIYQRHPELGWRRAASRQQGLGPGKTLTSDEVGSRVVPGATGPVSIATYGDSFTEAIDVDDPDSWQAFLSRETGTRVRNFGVSGYGPDQAVLALEEDLARGLSAPIVILAMINENLNRIMNTFRPFYTYPSADLALDFKTVFQKRGDVWEKRNFAPSNPGEREAIREAVHAAGAHDPFHAARTEDVRFPYIWHAAGFVARHGFSPQPIWPGLTDEARERMAYIVERFHSTARSHGLVPVFVVLPESLHDLQSRNGHWHPILGGIVEERALEGLVYIDVVQALTGPEAATLAPGFEPNRYIEVTHPSAHGNEAIANVILARLRAEPSTRAILEALSAPGRGR